MPKYRIFIFDCDGVVLDSNYFKIDAMRNALIKNDFTDIEVNASINYFKNNFGNSREHHVNEFLKNYRNDDIESSNLAKKIIHDYSHQVKEMYMDCDLTDGFDFIFQNFGSCKKYIASGSNEQELKLVFQRRKLAKYFVEIYGSPETKINNIANIIHQNQDVSKDEIVMIGDSVSDYQSARKENIGFLGYLKYSLVSKKMLELSKIHDFKILNHWQELNSYI
ncbi:HAD-IA family hydrolase [Gammaproteobacteria bacterium]|jgi:HAD superfamily hydrolase (TIGR01549 family)|nr:HAD-IA family hydrolase [Gammaproteobacteria bacterium]MDA7600884.1 HAD-IA family hydrolase [Gammaproteobacteria bacterium]MDC1021665.1 HAD-IA family hydrolase [Gammaproteobacteria bacterium]